MPLPEVPFGIGRPFMPKAERYGGIDPFRTDRRGAALLRQALDAIASGESSGGLAEVFTDPAAARAPLTVSDRLRLPPLHRLAGTRVRAEAPVR